MPAQNSKPWSVVKVESRFDEPLSVRVNTFQTLSPDDLIPPHTRRETPVAVIDRGMNFHGGMYEDFYVSVDSFPDDVSEWVLWLGDTGSQTDDTARLVPVARMDMIWRVGGEEVDWSEFDDGFQIVAESLLRAWTWWTVQSAEDHYRNAESCEGCKFSAEWADEILASALKGERVSG